MEWTDAREGPFIPEGLNIGSLKEVEPGSGVFVAMLFGEYAGHSWGPGAWLLGGIAGPWKRPLGGPFESTDDAERAWVLRETWAGWRAQLATVFEPVTMLRPDRIVFGDRSRVDSFVKIEGGDGVYLGRYVHIASFCHMNIGGGTLIMDEGSSAGSGARILSGSALLGHGSCSATHPDVKNAKTTTVIGKNATVFAGATVSVGCTLGEGSALAGGAFLRPHTDVPAGELWGGVPARFIKKITPVEPREVLR